MGLNQRQLNAGIDALAANPRSAWSACGTPRSIHVSVGCGRPSSATGDDGGEHVNSTIFSYAAYKMMTDPATSAVTLPPALAPLSVGTVRYSSPSLLRPHFWARAAIGTKPAHDTRFGSSKTAEATGRV